MKTETLTKVRFSDLDADNQDAAVTDMYNFGNSHNWPNHKSWRKIADVENDIEKGFNPDDCFSFYINEYNEVETKIG